MARNRAISSREVDNGRVAEGVWVFEGGRKHGIENELVHRF